MLSRVHGSVTKRDMAEEVKWLRRLRRRQSEWEEGLTRRAYGGGKGNDRRALRSDSCPTTSWLICDVLSPHYGVSSLAPPAQSGASATTYATVASGP